MRYFVCAWLLWWGIAQAEVLEKSVTPAPEEKLVQTVTNAVKSYYDLLKAEFGLEPQSVQIEFSTSEEDYSARLSAHGDKDAVRNAKKHTAVIFPKERLMVIGFNPGDSAAKIKLFIVQNLTSYSVQNDLASGKVYRARPWIRVGLGHYVDWVLLQKMGSESLERRRLETANALRLSDTYPMPQDMADMKNEDFLTLSEKEKRGHSLMADLMMVYLYEKKGSKLFGDLSDYYRCLGRDSIPETVCFSKYIGVEPEQFFPQVQNWVIETLEKSGGLDVVANEQEGIAAEISKVYAVQQTLLEEKLGRKLGITLRIHLSQACEEMAEQMVEELGMTKEMAATMAKSGWFSSDSVWFINTSLTNTPEKRADLIGTMVMGSYLESRADNMNQMYWLYAGLNDWMSAQLLNKLGLRSLAQTVALRKNVLENAKRGLPALSELTTLAAWREAKKKYGLTVVRQVAAEAANALLHKKGEAALEQWIESNMPLDGAPGGLSAFAQAFGETADTFVKNFTIATPVN